MDNSYGLIDPHKNQFVLIDDNYKILKILQTLISQSYFFPLITFNNDLKINNDNCYLFGCYQQDFTSFSIDQKVPNIVKNLKNINNPIQEKLLYIKNFLSILEINIEKYKKKVENTLPPIEHYNTLKDIFLTLIPSEELNEFITDEQKEIYSILQNFDDFYKEIIKFFFYLDIINCSNIDLKQKITEHLNILYNKSKFIVLCSLIDKIKEEM